MYDMAAVHAIDAHPAARDLQGLFDMERHLPAFRDFPRPFLGIRENRHLIAAIDPVFGRCHSALSIVRDERLAIRCGIWQGGEDYDPWTAAYTAGLARICRALAAEFDVVCEMTMGLPHVWKGELPHA